MNMKDENRDKELGMETHPGEDVTKEKFPHNRKLFHRHVRGKLLNLRRQHYEKKREKRNPTEKAHNHNYQQRSNSDARVCQQQVGLGREAPCCIISP